MVYDDHLEGYAWGENVGWIRLGTHAGGGAHTYGNASYTSLSHPPATRCAPASVDRARLFQRLHDPVWPCAAHVGQIALIVKAM